MSDSAERRHVVIVGAGPAGLETALALQALAHDVVSVEVVAPEREFVYRPMAVAEPFRVGEVRRFPLAQLVGLAGAGLRTGRVSEVVSEEKLLRLEDGDELPYDALVVATGARPREAVPGAITFAGPASGEALASLLERATAGSVKRIVFAMPPIAATGWPMPLYELALLTSEYLVDRMTRGVEVAIVTPEQRPLELFGAAAEAAISELLEIRGIRFVAAAAPVAFVDGNLQLAGDEGYEADAVVALPRLEGSPVPGLPHDEHGFVPTDELGWILTLTDAYAAGDVTQFPVKQGGIATQQADAVATSIAADAGAAVKPVTFTPILRGLLLTGLAPRFLRSAGAARSQTDLQPLWWPPSKVVGRYLSPFLAEHLGLAAHASRPPSVAAMPISVALDTLDHATWSGV